MVGYHTECRIECRAEPCGKVLLHLPFFIQIRTEHQRTESGRKRQGIDGRDTYSSSHGQTELHVECAAGASHHRHGNKHRHENQRGGNDGRGDAAHRVKRSHIRRLVSHIELGLHRLDHDNRIVNHNTDGKHQSEQRQQVDAEARNRHESERTDQRHQNRNGGNHHRLHILQEHVGDDDHQEECLEQCLHNLMHGSVEEVFRRVQFGKLYPFGQIFRHLLHLRVNLRNDFRSVRSCRLINHEQGTGLSVGHAPVVVCLITQLNACHILQTKHFACGKRLDDNTAELFRRDKTALVFHRVLEYTFVVLAERTCSRFDVLRIQRRSHITGHHTVLGHHIRLQPDAHTVV